jgi:hypothetical protein
MPVPPTAAQLRKTPAAAVTAIDELLDHHTHGQIAGILNARGLTSEPPALPWTVIPLVSLVPGGT